eukprot:PITA_01726
MQYFFGRMNFVRKFVSGFVEIVRPLQLMMKKDVVYKWSDEAKKAFRRIKEAIAEDLALVSPDFDMEFFLYTFASDVSYAAILTQKKNKGNEVPISYMSSNLQGAEFNYQDVEKQGYAVFKAVKHFRPYLLKARTKVIAPHPAVRALFMQKEMGERRGNWITTLQDFDLEIKPTQIVRGYGILDALIFDNASYFSSLKLTEFAINKSIHVRYATNYYPQGNRVAESSNKNLIRIIRKSVADNQRNWHNALTNALWANRVIPKVALGNSPYFLVYGQEAILPPNVTLPSLQLSQASRGTPLALLQERINQLMRLEELRDKARIKFKNHQMIVKIWFDHHHLARDNDFQIGELVLKWDKLNEPKGKHMKFQHLWLGPFQVVEKIGQGTYRLKTLQGETEKLPVNDQHLKRYFQ